MNLRRDARWRENEKPSEIVVPVFNKKDELMAVLDVDSAEYDAFDEVDKRHLEEIVALLAGKK